MARNLAKYRNIYLFISILALIGFICGFFYYKVQSPVIKENIKESINIEEDLNSGFNNIFKSSKKSLLILGSSILIITSIINVSKIFYEPFLIGFIFSFLCSYNFKLAFIYCFFYQLIPLLFFLILIRVGFTITLDIIKIIITREKKKIHHLKMIIIKYFIILLCLLIYEFIISIFSLNINAYLMTFIS